MFILTYPGKIVKSNFSGFRELSKNPINVLLKVKLVLLNRRILRKL